MLLDIAVICKTDPLAEVFYYIKNRLSFVTSKSLLKNLSNENKQGAGSSNKSKEKWQNAPLCTDVFVVFKAKSKLKCQFSGNIECVCFHY